MDFGPIEDRRLRAMQEAEARGQTDFADVLRSVTMLIALEKDSITVREGNGTQHEFPVRVFESRSGAYYQEFNGQSQRVRQAFADDGVLYTDTVKNGRRVTVDSQGREAPGSVVFMSAKLLAGREQFRALRASQKTFWRVGVTVSKPPSDDDRPPPARDEFPLHAYPELTPSQVSALLKDPKLNTREPLDVPGPGMGYSRYWPEHHEAKPLNFTFHGYHEGRLIMLVSRSFPGVSRPFYYEVPPGAVSSWLQSYIIDTVAKNTAGMAIAMQIMVDIAIGFMPIVGPLYNLYQSVRSGIDLYKNWDKMSGWEKALGGLDVLLVVLDVPKATRAAKGAIKLKGDVSTLVKAGVAKPEAKNLMVAANVLANDAAARKVAEALSDKLRAGGTFSPADVLKAEKLVDDMVKKLPKGEQALVRARYAMNSFDAAREYLRGVDLTVDMYNKGLRRLRPEMLVALEALAKEGKLTLAKRFVEWSMVDEIAAGMNQVVDVAKPGHITDLIATLGQDTLLAMGRGDFTIPLELANAVRRQNGSLKAYRVLMRGGKTKAGQVFPGLRALLESSRTLPADLQALAKVVPDVYLSEAQLRNLAKLDSLALSLLTDSAVYHSQIREIAMIASSDAAVRSINALATTMVGSVKPYVIAGVVERLGKGFLILADKHGLTVGPNLVKTVGKTTDARTALWTLLRGTKAVPGWFDTIVGTIPTPDALDEVVKSIGDVEVRAELFAKWAMKNSDQIPGADVIKKLRKNPEQSLKKIHMMFGVQDVQNVKHILAGLRWIEDRSGQLSALIADLAAGPEKAMGASLTLDWVIKNADLKKGTVVFEQVEKVAAGVKNVTRKYDLVFDGLQYEFKYWTAIEGKHIAAAMDEFRRDILIHANEGFRNLRWVISSNVEPSREMIAAMMRDVVHSNREFLETALKAQKSTRTVADIERDLNAALNGALLSFH